MTVNKPQDSAQQKLQRDLQRRLGYTFADESLLALALTHKSLGSSNYERLEFLGDSVLNFVIALALYRQFPDGSEGQFTRLRATLVQEMTLAEVARELNLGPCLKLSENELKSGGYNRDSILSDAFEGLVGAILLDGDIDQASAAITRLFAPRLASLSLDASKDAKTRLQEHLQGLGLDTPDYHLARTNGKPPEQEFEIECRVENLPAPVLTKGSSRRGAEQKAAAEALRLLAVDK